MSVDLTHSMLLMIFVQSALVVISYFGTIALRQDLSSTLATVGARICGPPCLDCGRIRGVGSVPSPSGPLTLRERFPTFQIVKASTGSLIFASLTLILFEP